MRSTFRTLLALALPCVFLATLATPVRAQQDQKPHPITSLPLPPDEVETTPAAKTPTAVPTPAPAAKPSRRHGKTPAGTLPPTAPTSITPVTPAPGTSAPSLVVTTPETPAPAAAPVVKTPAGKHGKKAPPAPAVAAPAPDTSAPSLVVVTPETPAPAATKTPIGKHGKKTPASVSAATSEGGVHAITGLPLPPDEEPATTPTKSVPVAPAPVKPTPVPVAKPVPAPTKRTHEPKPAPVVPPAVEKPTPVTPPPAPKTVEKPVVIPSTPAPKPAEKPVVAPSASAPTTSPKPVKIEPIVPVVPTPVTPPASVPETPKTTTPTPEPAVTKPAVVKPETVAPKAASKTVVIPPTPVLKPRNPAPSKPSTVILPKQPAPAGSGIAPLEPVPTPTAPRQPESSPQPAVQPAQPHFPTGTGTVSTVAPSPEPAGTLGAIIFHGADPFTADELTPITGLSLGTTPTEESLQKASRQLIDTGYFFNVAATFDSVAGVGTATFNLQPAPTDQLRRLSFANFVWLSPAEIDDVLKRVPLYHGYGSVPASNNGALVAAIQSALSRALLAKGVSAMITHGEVSPNVLHPYAAIEFRVTEPHVVLESASLFDIPPALVAKVLKAQELAVKQPYNEGIAGTTLSDLLLRPARDAGYIGAKLWRIDRKRKSMGNNVGVIFTARMDAGPLYTVRSLSWTPSPIYSSSDFHRNAGLIAGKPPTPGGLDKTQQSILDAYHAQGYVDAVVLINTDLDAKSGGANYIFSVNPGAQYTLRSITLQGLPPDVQKDFESHWTLKPGDVYNEDYLLNYLNNHPEIKSLKGYTFDYNRTVTTDSHMVDLTVTFKQIK